MKLNLEFIYSRITSDKVHYWINTIDITDTMRDPDKIVLQILENDLDEAPKLIHENYLIHSTSWRYEKTGTVVLTYLIYSDHLNFDRSNVKIIAFENLRIATNTSHKVPRPETIKKENVVAHALRHLAFLVKSGHHENYKKILTHETLTRLEFLEGIPAGKLE